MKTNKTKTLVETLLEPLPERERLRPLVEPPLYSSEGVRRYMLDGVLPVYREGDNSRRRRVLWTVCEDPLEFKRPERTRAPRSLRPVPAESRESLKAGSLAYPAELLAYIAATGGVEESLVSLRTVTREHATYYLYWGVIVPGSAGLYLIRTDTPNKQLKRFINAAWILSAEPVPSSTGAAP